MYILCITHTIPRKDSRKYDPSQTLNTWTLWITLKRMMTNELLQNIQTWDRNKHSDSMTARY